MRNPFSNLSERPTARAVIAAFIASAIALFGIIVGGGTEEQDREIVEKLCSHGLDKVAGAGGLDLCTHGGDPKQAFPPTARSEPNVYRQTDLCPGDGVSGSRVRVYVARPSDTPALTGEQVNDARNSIGVAERTLRLANKSYYQKVNWYCAIDKTPTLGVLTLPPIGNRGTYGDRAHDELTRTLTQAEGGSLKDDAIYVALVANVDNVYPYCGEGTLMFSDAPAVANAQLHDPQVSYVALGCGGATVLHELGHNIGAVQLSAPDSSGAWHCRSRNGDTMCYNDGGDKYSQLGASAGCPAPVWKVNGDPFALEQFDCGNDDYYSGLPSTRRTGYLSTHWDVTDSPFLTKPRKK